MDHTPQRRGRGLLIGAGVVLVAAFFGWLVVRNQDLGAVDLSMGSALGWITQPLAWAILLGGVALIARGTTRGSTKSDRED